ncbi:MAG: hypothetical protein ACRC92_21830 [Peptostreptococcaceae bacterium]
MVFIGFGRVNGETKAIYFEKSTTRYKVLETIKDFQGKYYIGMFWKYVTPERIEVVFTEV